MSSFDPAKSKASKDESVASPDEFESAFEKMLENEESATAHKKVSSPDSEPNEFFDVEEIAGIFSSDTQTEQFNDSESEFTDEFQPADSGDMPTSRAEILNFTDNSAKSSAQSNRQNENDVTETIADFNAALEALESLDITQDELVTADAISNPFIEEGSINESYFNTCYQESTNEEQLDSDFDVDYFIEESFKDLELRPSFLYKFATKLPSAYLMVTSISALLGFMYFALFPMALVYVSFNGFEMLNSPLKGNGPYLMLALLGFTLVIFTMFWKLLDLEFVEPQGLVLDEENASKLFESLEAIKQDFRIPTLHKVILTRRHELNLIKMPRFGVPVWSRNILAIGYPLMQTLSPAHFDSVLKRRLLQYGKRTNMLLNWLGFMRNTWVMYASSLKKRRHFLDLLHYCFFGVYSAFYRNLAVYAAQRDELHVDGKALRYCNDRDLIESAATIRITKAMLVQYFWPKLKSAMKNEHVPPSELTPYSSISKTLHQLLDNDKSNTWFIRLAREAQNQKTPEPAFADRMQRMGFKKIHVPQLADQSAANFYFGEEEEDVTVYMNELWALQVDKEIFLKNIQNNELGITLPSRASLPSS